MRIHAFRSAAMLCALTSTHWSAQAQEQRYTGYRVVEILLQTDADLAQAESLGANWSCVPSLGWSTFSISPADWPTLQLSGLTFQVASENLQELIDAERASSTQRVDAWFTSFHDYDGINAYLDTLVALRPDLVTKINLGTSLQGRAIYGLQITGAGGTAAKPAIFFDACQHAREWLSPTTVTFIADQLIRNYGTDPTLTGMLDRAVYYIVPLSNPDGYVYTWTTDRLWRKNRRTNGGGSFGVDLNRNWGYQWGLSSGSSSDPRSDVYHGTAAFSEPETQRLRDFGLAHPEIVAYIDFHTYSQLILSPWGYSTGEPAEPDRTTFRNLNTLLKNAILDTHGVNYTAGPAGATLYLASGIAPDWFYGTRGVLGWTIELRPSGSPGFIVPPDQIIPTGEENLAAAMVLAEQVAPGCPGDLNNDGLRDISDLGVILANFDKTGLDYAGGDVDFDGDVDLSDLGAELSLFGTACP